MSFAKNTKFLWYFPPFFSTCLLACLPFPSFFVGWSNLIQWQIEERERRVQGSVKYTQVRVSESVLLVEIEFDLRLRFHDSCLQTELFLKFSFSFSFFIIFCLFLSSHILYTFTAETTKHVREEFLYFFIN